MASQTDTIPLVPLNDYNKEGFQPPAYSDNSQPPQSAVPAAPEGHQYPPQQPVASQSQMSSNNTVVVTGQPTQLPPVTVHQPTMKPKQNILIFSLVLISCCSFNIASLFCLIPAVIFAVLGFNYGHSHDPSRRQTGRGLNGVSLCCSITALVSVLTTILCVILFFSIFYGRLNTFFSCRSACYYQECYYDHNSCNYCYSRCTY